MANGKDPRAASGKPGRDGGTEKTRCPWCLGEKIYVDYHDHEWGRPVKDSRKLFSRLLLDNAQAGLSWLTILKRREGYYAAMDNLDPEKLARYTEADITRLMNDTRIIRNRLKIVSAINNARAFLRFQDKEGSFGKWLWDHVDGVPELHHFQTMESLPASTPLSESISKDLKRRGFSFVGPVIIYAFLQAAGLVNDHLVSCWLHPGNLPGQKRGTAP